MIVGLRRGAVNTGKWEDEYGTKLFLNLERNGNALGFAASERQKFIEKSGLPIYDGTQEYCLWLGCMGAYDPQGREIVLALARVLRHAGVTFGVLRKEKCTGDPARRLGNDLAVSAGGRSQHRDAAAPPKSARWSRSARTACAPSATDWREYGADVPDRASQRAAGARAARSCPRRPGRAKRWCFTTPAIWAVTATCTRRRATWSRAVGDGGRAGARARALVLLRRRRRADVPRRGEGQARERGAGGRTGGDRRAGHRHGMSLLPDDVPRRVGRDGKFADRAAETADIVQLVAAGLPAEAQR